MLTAIGSDNKSDLLSPQLFEKIHRAFPSSEVLFPPLARSPDRRHCPTDISEQLTSVREQRRRDRLTGILELFSLALFKVVFAVLADVL